MEKIIRWWRRTWPFQPDPLRLSSSTDSMPVPPADLTRFLCSDLDVTRKAVVTSKLPYEAAGWLGKHRGSEACEAVYGTLCPYNKQDMMQLVSSVWSSMAKEEDNNVLSA